MAIMHEMAAGMGGIRTAGDLVARMVMKGMKIDAAKEYVANKLGCSVFDLSDSAKMKEIRESLDIGTVVLRPHGSNGMAAKIKIAELLNIKIPSKRPAAVCINYRSIYRRAGCFYRFNLLCGILTCKLFSFKLQASVQSKCEFIGHTHYNT